MLYKSSQVAGNQPAITGDEAGDTLNTFSTVTDTATTASDILAFYKLPADHVPVDGILMSDAAVTVTVGVMNAAGTDLIAGTDFVTATAIPANGMVRFANPLGLKLAPVSTDRIIAAKVTTGSGVANVSLSFTYRAA